MSDISLSVVSSSATFATIRAPRRESELPIVSRDDARAAWIARPTLPKYVIAAKTYTVANNQKRRDGKRKGDVVTRAESINRIGAILKRGEENAKLRKTLKELGIDSVDCGSVTLRPSDGSGYDVCALARFAACHTICVMEKIGMANWDSVKASRDALTRWLFEDTAAYLGRLDIELGKMSARAEKSGKLLYVRLNTGSDIRYERIARWLFDSYPNVRFYDYTKLTPRLFDDSMPRNYSLSYSVHGNSKDTDIRAILERGKNCVVVTDSEYNGQRKIFGALPDTMEIAGARFNTRDGDKLDFRHEDFDGRGNLVLLRFKGSRAELPDAILKSKFVRPVETGLVAQGKVNLFAQVTISGHAMR